MLRARRSASCLVSSSTRCSVSAACWRASSSTSLQEICLACAAVRPEICSSSRSWRRLTCFSSSRWLLEVALAVVERLAPALELAQLRVDRLRLPQRPLLHARDLLAAGAQLDLRLATPLPSRVECRGRSARPGGGGADAAGVAVEGAAEERALGAGAAGSVVGSCGQARPARA